MSEIGKSQHILSLAEEIITDIENKKISGESLVFKASRLASLAGSERIQKWLSYEKNGYNATEPISLEYLRYTYRIVTTPLKNTYYGSLASQEMTVEGYKLRLENLKHNPEPKKPAAYQAIQLPSVDKTIVDLMNQHQLIIKKVISLIHDFATSVYYSRLFSNYSENIFENFKTEIDNLLAQSCGEVLQKIPSIYRRLTEGDTEAISQALTTCRRIIDSFADTIYPPSKIPIDMGGQEVKLTAQHHQNRINAYIRERVSSDSRRVKFRQSLSNLYGRVSAGVHTDVTLSEARSLFLETYLLLGEIIAL